MDWKIVPTNRRSRSQVKTPKGPLFTFLTCPAPPKERECESQLVPFLRSALCAVDTVPDLGASPFILIPSSWRNSAQYIALTKKSQLSSESVHEPSRINANILNTRKR